MGSYLRLEVAAKFAGRGATASGAAAVGAVRAAGAAAVGVPVEVRDDASLERIRRGVAILGLAGVFYPRRPAMAAGPVFEVEALLRRFPGLWDPTDFAETCRRAGMREAAMFLEDASAWERVDYLAVSLYGRAGGTGFLAAGDVTFPVALRGRVPVLWCRQHPDYDNGPALSGRSIPVSVVGSRSPGTAAVQFVFALGATLAQKGCALVSGGAPGVDRIAAAAYLRSGGSDLTEFWPCGLLQPWSAVMDSNDVWAEPEFEGRRRIRTLAAAAPHEPFSAARAMERNGFIYAAGAVTVVVEARLREGGTWHGAVSALRRGERVMVFMREEGSGDGEEKSEDKLRGGEGVEDMWNETEMESSDRENVARRAARALCALGAIPIRSVDDVLAYLDNPESKFRRPGNASLFDDVRPPSH